MSWPTETQARRRGHRFAPTKAVARGIPALGATDGDEDPLVRAHYFGGAADWYVVELDPDTGQAFGWADLGFGTGELGYFDLGEMERLRVGLVIVERDMHWKPVPLSAIIGP